MQVALVTLLSQAGFGIEKLATVSLQKRIIEKLSDMKEHKLWVRYKIARQAARLVSLFYFVFQVTFSLIAK